jgi:5-methylcytosine-specific restriction endonuclease McrA
MNVELGWSLNARPGVRHRIWRGILAPLQDGLCPICGKPLRGGGKTNLDHTIPRSAGGEDRLGNIMVVHIRCNDAKADRMPTGCELVWLLGVNARLGVQPQKW